MSHTLIFYITTVVFIIIQTPSKCLNIRPPVSWIDTRCFDGRYSPVLVFEPHNVVSVSTPRAETRLNVTSPSYSNDSIILKIFYRRLGKPGVLF